MGKARGSVRTVGDHCRSFLGELGALDNGLDVLLLLLALLIVAPPHGSLVITLQAEMLAGLAGRVAFVALLPSQTTCEATYEKACQTCRDKVRRRRIWTYLNEIACASSRPSWKEKTLGLPWL